MKAGIVQFAGSNCDHDSYHVLKNIFGFETELLWHKDRLNERYDLIILPGGFSYGDHLRPGAIARFSPVMEDVIKQANSGVLTIGICNGFQVLCESGLLPGVLMRNKKTKFICKDNHLKVENEKISENIKKNIIKLPIAHADGNYFAKEDTVKKMQDNNRVLIKYCDIEGNTDRKFNPNGSSENIAGIINENRNIIGMMPHPERASEKELGNMDGYLFFKALFEEFGRF